LKKKRSKSKRKWTKQPPQLAFTLFKGKITIRLMILVMVLTENVCRSIAERLSIQNFTFLFLSCS